jgi:cell division protein FtsI/penicillin-binding protein 2
MQDFKHIAAGTPRRFFSRKKSAPRNELKMPQPPPPPQRGKRLRFLLPVMAIFLALIPLLGQLRAERKSVAAVKPPAAPVKPYSPLDSYQAFKLAADAIGSCRLEGNRYCATLADGGTIVYAINEEVQQRVKKVMEQHRVPYGTFVAIEPKTGRILALAGYSALDPGWEQRCLYGLYPMASLFKIVTASAALEMKKVSPETVVAFGGRLTSENPKYWGVVPRRGGQRMDLSIAMGKSVNPVFGRLAGEVVGRDTLMSYVEKFGFNQALLPGTALTPSQARQPQSLTELQLMGAGLAHEVKISPLHAAMIMAALANRGAMPMPSLVTEIRNGKGEVISAPQGQVLRQLVSPETAGQLARMLATTVNKGTSRKMFHDRRGRPLLSSINVAAKTGSIDGTDPAGHYSWFAAYAPIDDPQIALAALVINKDKWKIKASYLGEQALEAFFK